MRLPPALHGLILDHLGFRNILQATTTDRAARAALGHVRNVHAVGQKGFTPNLVAQLSRCESIAIAANSAVVLEKLAWALPSLPHLQKVLVNFMPGADMSSWHQTCETLARSMEDVTRIAYFCVASTRRKAANGPLVYCPLDPVLLADEAYHRLLFRLPLDCALLAATTGLVPYAVVEKLLTRGANPNHDYSISGNEYISCLSDACAYQSFVVIRLLLERGARNDDLGQTRAQRQRAECFHSAFARTTPARLQGSIVDVLRLLYGAGLQSRRRGSAGLLHSVVRAMRFDKPVDGVDGPLEVIKLIVERQPGLVTLSDHRGDTPLAALLRRQPMDAEMPKGVVKIAKLLALCESDARSQATP